MELFNEALCHARATGQEPTEWLFNKAIERIYVGDERKSLEGGPEIMGLPIYFDCGTPINKVVLKAGRNTVMAFIVPVMLDLSPP